MNIDEGLRRLNPVIPVTTSDTNPEICIDVNPPLIQPNYNGNIDYHITDAQKLLPRHKNSCLEPKRMVFACPRARVYGVRSEVEL